MAVIKMPDKTKLRKKSLFGPQFEGKMATEDDWSHYIHGCRSRLMYTATGGQYLYNTYSFLFYPRPQAMGCYCSHSGLGRSSLFSSAFLEIPSQTHSKSVSMDSKHSYVDTDH